jgi:trk system potassium uptake protein TrkA
MRVVILGGGELGRTLAELLHADYNSVTLLDEDPRVTERLSGHNLSAETVDDIRDVSPLAGESLEFATVVVATEHDSANLLITHLIRKRVGGGRLIVRVNDSQNRSLFEDLEVEAISATNVVAYALATAVRSPA